MTAAMRALLAAAGAAAVGLQVLHARRNWGATAEEVAASLPGDELVPEPAEETTLAVTVDAPPEEIWAWLVQMGRGRGGMYSYDWLENLLGLDIHTTDEIRPEWQQLAVGDRVAVVREGYGPMPAGYSFRVAHVEPPRALVLQQAPPEHPWNGVWSFHVLPAAAGSCRLLSRARTQVAPQAGMRIATRLGEPVTLVMTRRMLRGIRQRAEGRAPSRAADGPFVRCRLTNAVANPVLRRLLRSRAGRRPGRRLAVIRYTGVRTGRVHELVAGYARAGATAWIWVGDAGSKRWWRNFRSPGNVELWLAGDHATGTAVAVEGAQQPEECREGVLVYLAAVPGAARMMRLPADPEQIGPEALRGVVMVRVELPPPAPPVRAAG